MSQEDASRSLLSIFKNHYANLCRVLPVEELIPEFVACDMITFDEEEEISSNPRSSERARLLLLHVRKALHIGVSRLFYKLLEIMRQSGQSECKELAERIGQELPVNVATAQEISSE